jgi:tRNA A37 threonylcarbamoyladenosine dehydratase
MGAGGKLDPTRFEAADIYATSVCPLCKVMRKLLRDAGIEGLRVVYSKEEPAVRANPIPSVAFVPSVMGLILAGEVVKGIRG